MKSKKDITQHWQEMYDAYKKTGNISIVLKDKVITGLISNTINKWNIPSTLHDDLKQEICLAISRAFETYDGVKCDKVLPYVLNGIKFIVYTFLNKEIYNRTWDRGFDRFKEITLPSIPEQLEGWYDPIEEQEDNEEYTNKINAFENWLRTIIPDPVEWEVYCHQWGIFNHDKLKNKEICEKLGLSDEKVNKIKLRIIMKIRQQKLTKSFVKKLGPLGYYILKEYKKWK